MPEFAPARGERATGAAPRLPNLAEDQSLMQLGEDGEDDHGDCQRAGHNDPRVVFRLGVHTRFPFVTSGMSKSTASPRLDDGERDGDGDRHGHHDPYLAFRLSRPYAHPPSGNFLDPLGATTKARGASSLRHTPGGPRRLYRQPG
jgi:hypothetical protein